MRSVQIITGDCLDVLRTLPEASVHCVVTSPPYFGLRDYGHTNQLGLEKTPALYVEKMVEVFRSVWRVLRDDGTLWLNIGDSYCAPNGRSSGGGTYTRGPNSQLPHMHSTQERGIVRSFGDAKPKDLLMIPALVALALRADGWYVRSDIIWNKPNPMPESVTDRPTKAHEYLFLLSKNERYYYDAEAIREPLSEGTIARISQPNLENQRGSDRGNGGAKTNGPMKAVVRTSGQKVRKRRQDHGGVEGSTSNQGFGVPWASDGSHRPQYKRALEIAEAGGLTEQHFEAIRSCGFFGDSNTKTRLSQNGTENEAMLALAREAKEVLGGYYREFLQGGHRNRRSVWTITTKPFKGAHFAVMPTKLVEPCILAGCPAGGVVLDPFTGAGTVGLVANRLGRDFIGVELNSEYATMARERIRNDAPLFAESEEPAA